MLPSNSTKSSTAKHLLRGTANTVNMDGSDRASKGQLEHLGHYLLIVEKTCGASFGLGSSFITILDRLVFGLGACIICA
jgi:hypothetical protein